MTLHRTPVGDLPLFDPAQGVAVMRPEVDEPGHWVGAPAVWVEGDALYLSVRHRRPLGRGRGWKSAIYQTSDGVTLEQRWHCTAAQFGTESIERCALVHAPAGPWRYYVSYVDPADRRWRIDLLEADCVERLDPAVRVPVLDAATTDSEGVKDPVVLLWGGPTHLFAGYGPRASVLPGATPEDLHGTGNVFTTGLVAHPSGHWVSHDGHAFEYQRDVVSPGAGWDANMARLSAVMPADAGFLMFYDGRTGKGDVYEDRTGLASSTDLVRVQVHTRDAPILSGASGTRCLRYLDWARLGGELLYYYETSTPNGAHELRVSQVPLG